MPTGIHDSPRGLKLASKEVRQRVTQAGGLSVSVRLGDLFCQARAEKGGQATFQKYGSDYYKKMAKKRRT